MYFYAYELHNKHFKPVYWFRNFQSMVPISPAAIWKLHDSSTRWSLHSDEPGMSIVQLNLALETEKRRQINMISVI